MGDQFRRAWATILPSYQRTLESIAQGRYGTRNRFSESLRDQDFNCTVTAVEATGRAWGANEKQGCGYGGVVDRTDGQRVFRRDCPFLWIGAFHVLVK